MGTRIQDIGLKWEKATGLASRDAARESAPHCALVPDTEHDCDQIAVVYDKGKSPPTITITQVSGSVHTVMADGIAVAVVARASGPAPCADDVILVERTL